MKNTASERLFVKAIPFALVLLALFVFSEVRYFEFINLDDDKHVSENPYLQNGVTWEGIRRAFSADFFRRSPNIDYWQPVTFLSRMTDLSLFGLRAGFHHAVNLFFHIANILLLFFLWKRLSGNVWQSAVIAALFAVHPLGVESVAWITERKNVLSACFGFLSLLAYTGYVRRFSRRQYGLALTAFLLSLMSKPSLITLPLLLLLMDDWPLGRFQTKSFDSKKRNRLLFEKIPFFLLSGVSAAVTLFGQSQTHIYYSSPGVLLSKIPENFAGYLGNVIAPVRLSLLSPEIYNTIHWGWFFASTVLLIVMSAAAICERRRKPYLFFGWFWFLICLLPAVTLVPMANRFTYVPLVGLLVILTGGAADLLSGFTQKKVLLTGLAGVLVIISAVLSRTEVSYWKNSETLFRHALRVNENNYKAHHNLGAVLHREGKLDEAILHYQRTLELNPDYTNARSNLCAAFFSQGKMDVAIRECTQAIRERPDLAEPRHNLSVILAKQGKLEEAIRYDEEALRLNPDFSDAHASLGNLLARQKKFEEAYSHFKEVVRLKHRDTNAWNNLRSVLFMLGKSDEAADAYRTATQLDPRNFEAQKNLSVTLNKLKAK